MVKFGKKFLRVRLLETGTFPAARTLLHRSRGMLAQPLCITSKCTVPSINISTRGGKEPAIDVHCFRHSLPFVSTVIDLISVISEGIQHEHIEIRSSGRPQRR